MIVFNQNVTKWKLTEKNLSVIGFMHSCENNHREMEI